MVKKQARRPVEEEVFAKMDREERQAWDRKSAADRQEILDIYSTSDREPRERIDDHTVRLEYMEDTDNAEPIQGTDADTNMFDEVIDTILRCHYSQTTGLQHVNYAAERKVLDDNKGTIDGIVQQFVRAYDPTMRLVRDGEVAVHEKPMHMRSYLKRKRVWSYLIAKPDSTGRELEERFGVTQQTMSELLRKMKRDGSVYHNDRHPREWRAVENFVWR